jgi:hypothetical protein
MSSPASLGLTIEGNEYRVKGKKGGLIKINKLTIPQLKAYGAKYKVNFTAKNRTKKQILNKIYAAKSGQGPALLPVSSNRFHFGSGNNAAASLIQLAGGSSKSSSYNANLAAAQALAAMGKIKPTGGKSRLSALLNVAAKPSQSSGMGINVLFQTPQVASLGLMRNKGSNGGYRIQGKKGPVKINKLTLQQLKNYAAKHNANISGLKKKKNILAVIHARKFRPGPMYKVKPPRPSKSSSHGGSVNAVVNNLFQNVLKPKAKPKPTLNFSPPRSGSLGLLRNKGNKNAYMFKGVRGPKKVNAKMTVAALRNYAEKYDVNASKMRVKANIIAAIYKKKFGGSSSRSRSSSRSSSGPVLITQAQAVAMLAGRKSSSNKPQVRPKVRPPRPAGPAAGPVKLTKAQLNKLLGSN